MTQLIARHSSIKPSLEQIMAGEYSFSLLQTSESQGRNAVFFTVAMVNHFSQ
ncbi:MAG: hypothetical protein AAGL24_29650 [Pseudomonadota bacterium]